MVLVQFLGRDLVLHGDRAQLILSHLPHHHFPFAIYQLLQPL